MQSPAMQKALELCRIYAPVDRPIVFVGPVGAGKTTLARETQRLSDCRGKFVRVSSGDLPESFLHDVLFGHISGSFTGATGPRDGAIVEASDGVLFLDDFPHIAMSAQVALLRVLDSASFRPLGATERQSRCRFMFASTVELPALVESGRLLPDLKSRLGELIIHVPPLSERRESICPLATIFAEALLRRRGFEASVDFSQGARKALRAYAWPENVRELEGVAERAVLHAGMRHGEIMIEPAHLPDRVRYRDGAPPPVRQPLSREVVAAAVTAAHGNKSEAARRLNVHRNTIARYMP